MVCIMKLFQQRMPRPACDMVMYQEDVILFGPAAEVAELLPTLQAYLLCHGLELAPGKWKV
eukprot:5421570-Amphidinium_carterae.2